MHLYLFSSIYIRYTSPSTHAFIIVRFGVEQYVRGILFTLTIMKYDRNNQGRLLEEGAFYDFVLLDFDESQLQAMEVKPSVSYGKCTEKDIIMEL